MSSAIPEQIRNCKRCSAALAAGALACENCHALVYGEELEQFAAKARELESRREVRPAREQWLLALALLPPEASQAKWIRDHAIELEATATMAEAPEPENKWAQKLGPVGPIAVLLAKSKSLLAIFKLKFLLNLAAFMGVYWAIYGVKFGVGFALLILIHEMGHFIDVKRRGLPADLPVFLPGLGAYVRWQALGVTLKTRAEVSLAGPLAGLLAAIACAALWWTTGNGIWAALSRAGAWLNLLNLIPVWILDGGQAVLALNKTERLVLLTACLAFWLVLGENVFFLVALGAGWKLFTKDLPAHSARSTIVYFVALLALLGIVMRLMPAQGFGR